MLSLRREKFAEISIPISAGWLLGACMEARGKQDLWTSRKPDLLEALREQTIVRSVESSNRIEGVTIPADRLRPVVLGKEKPRDRSEEELAGYREAIDWIFSLTPPVPVTPSALQRLHSLAQRASGDAGEWKKRNNEIIEIMPDGERKVRFVPTSAEGTPGTVELLCRNYNEMCDDERIPPLLLIATFVFDLLCIHPFRDGNGRVSRLATTLLLWLHGFQVGQYISLERLIEENKEGYYSVLAECSAEWHEGTNEIIPWWNYFLGMVRRAYKEFERRVESVAVHPPGSDYFL